MNAYAQHARATLLRTASGARNPAERYRWLWLLFVLSWSANAFGQAATPAPAAPGPDKPADKRAAPAPADAKKPGAKRAAPRAAPAPEAAPAQPETAPKTPGTAEEGKAEAGKAEAGKPEAGAEAQPEAKSEAQSEQAGAAPEAAGTGKEAAAAESSPTPEGSPAPALPAPAAPANAVPSPGEMENMLSQQLAQSPQQNTDWTAPTPVLTLHGYYRARGELMDTFWLGRRQLTDYLADTTIPADTKAGQGPDPFTRFRPLERQVLPTGSKSTAPAGLQCVSYSTRSDHTCDVSTLRFANMRLRLSPQLNVSEDVRVKMSFDVFDNLVLGDPPAGYYGASIVPAGSTGAGKMNGADAAFASTQNPDSLAATIKPRRVWAEIRNRDLGELRFGRMPMSWGMGLAYNAGDRLDDDLSTDMDRIVGITKLAGLYFSASYDFLSQGLLDYSGTDNRPLDRSQLDDAEQFTFSVARRHTPEELATAKERGDAVLNGGAQLSIRSQDSLYIAPSMPSDKTSPFHRLNATTRTTDLWGLFKLRGLRIEGEFVWVNGGMDNLAAALTAPGTSGTSSAPGSYKINQLGYALQTELRLLNEKLGIYLEHGLATGDSDVDGLSSDADYITQQGNNRTISTFRFHPSYRVDLILWRNIMRQVTGAYYFRPSVSYDFVRSAFGQLAGARLDFIWSRATSYLQTWGNNSNLGIEIDASLYFRSEDGPELDDGFHAMIQYGVLFPMKGLSYLHESTNLDTAQTLRLVLGVVF